MNTLPSSMNPLSKYILFFLVLFCFAKFGFAQDSSKTETKGEIVMSKTDLESFLMKIAELKKSHIAAQKEAENKRNINLRNLKKSYSSQDEGAGKNPVNPQWREYRNEEFYSPVRQYHSVGEEQLVKELNEIHATLDSLLFEIEALKVSSELADETGRSTFSQLPVAEANKQPGIRVETQRRPIIIQQETPAQVYGNGEFQESTTWDRKNNKQSLPYQEQPQDSTLSARQSEQAVLKNRINELENEMFFLQELLKGSGEDEKNTYNEDVAKLKAQIDTLSTQLNQKNREEDSIIMKTQNKVSGILNDFLYNIYFENNSIRIPPSDYSKLHAIVNIAKQHPQIPVVLRGFASKAGNSQYNNRLSFLRSESVKRWLLENGLNLKDVIIMSHGEDKSVDATQARRVEITFKTN